MHNFDPLDSYSNGFSDVDTGFHFGLDYSTNHISGWVNFMGAILAHCYNSSSNTVYRRLDFDHLRTPNTLYPTLVLYHHRTLDFVYYWIRDGANISIKNTILYVSVQ